jgi:hypothetical protein
LSRVTGEVIGTPKISGKSRKRVGYSLGRLRSNPAHYAVHYYEFVVQSERVGISRRGVFRHVATALNLLKDV